MEILKTFELAPS